MHDTKGNKHHFCIRDKLTTSSSSHPPEGEEASITLYEFKNAFCEKKTSTY